jgi:hypothetical protein
MSEAQDRKVSKLNAMREYFDEAFAAYLRGDEYEYRENIEHLMGVVGSEVQVYGGVPPTYQSTPPEGTAPRTVPTGELDHPSQHREPAIAQEPTEPAQGKEDGPTGPPADNAGMDTLDTLLDEVAGSFPDKGQGPKCPTCGFDPSQYDWFDDLRHGERNHLDHVHALLEEPRPPNRMDP